MFIAFPLLALAIGGAFIGAWRFRHARSAAVAGLLWLLYGTYEYLMRARILCSGECNIRIDLFLIYPMLLAVSIIALWNTVRRPRQPRT